MAASMIVLYIISIGVAWLFGKKTAEDEERLKACSVRDTGEKIARNCYG